MAEVATAGNPDRQGESGAYELLINPWARGAGLHTLNTAGATGVDALQLNVAGLARISKTQITLGHTRYLVGADINMNALGMAQRVGKSGAFGVSLISMDFGEIPLTSVVAPDGSGATFSPSFTNIGISYSHVFENKVAVGVTFKAVNESITNASARGMALDAGVQYVTGAKDNFKFGIFLRNIGSKMRFQGEGLTIPRPNPDGTFNFNLSYYNRGERFEMPSQLNIGASYSWFFGSRASLTAVGNFTSNAFSRDNVGGGVEFNFGKTLSLRAGYRTELDTDNAAIKASVDNGVSAGFSISTAVKKDSDTRVSFDYAYRQTNIWSGTHNLGIRLDL